MKTSVLNLEPDVDETFEGNEINRDLWRVWGEKWDDYVGYDHGVIRAANVRQENGELILSMTRRAEPKTFKGSPDVQRDWDTGWVSTNPAYGAVHMAYEIEAMIPAAETISAGVWNGVWSRAFDKAVKGEIDGAESFGDGGTGARQNPTRPEAFTATVHWDQTGANHVSKESPKALKPISTAWHKYGVYKSLEEIIIYFDGEEIFHVNRKDTPEKWAAAFPDNAPFDLRLCLQAGGSWGGYPNEGTPDVNELRVRRVRIWNFDK